MKPLGGDELRALFDAPPALSVGLEEEVMLLEPDTLELVECAPLLLERLPSGPRFKLEMPASQLELVTSPVAGVPSAVAELASARRTLLKASEGLARPAVAGVHPFSSGVGGLNSAPRYERTANEYGLVARRQLVCALHIHVTVGGAERTLAVYNGLRHHLPALAALAANAPYYEGYDTGLASVRPKIAELLPRQGLPPAFSSWDEVADELRWGARAGSVPEPSSWWWELRPNLTFGTLELRVPDAQTTLADAGAIAALAHALAAWLAERHDAGEATRPVPAWRIEQNRWSACRHGVEGAFADLHSGEPTPTRDRLLALIESVEPWADRLGATNDLSHARALVERNGAMRQRAAGADGGPRQVADWLTKQFRAGL